MPCVSLLSQKERGNDIVIVSPVRGLPLTQHSTWVVDNLACPVSVSVPGFLRFIVVNFQRRFRSSNLIRIDELDVERSRQRHSVKGCPGLCFAFIIYEPKCLYDVAGDTFAFSWLNEPEFYLEIGQGSCRTSGGEKRVKRHESNIILLHFLRSLID